MVLIAAGSGQAAQAPAPSDVVPKRQQPAGAEQTSQAFGKAFDLGKGQYRRAG